MGKGGKDIPNQTEGKTRKISLEELSHHRTPTDAWLAYRGKVYDVSNWETHPGGSVIFTHAGDDCTDIFAAFHPGSALKELSRFEIGEVDESIIPSAESTVQIKSDKQKAFEESYRSLRAKMQTMGLFHSSYPYYIYKVTANLTILALSVFLAWVSDNFWINMLGAVVMGLFWQQCGWLAHDFLHHQVFKTRAYGDMAGLIIGNLFQGFSVAWWKSKHNSHHAVPNLHASRPEACDGDPDIDTMPILAWTLRMAESARDSPTGRMLINWQAYFYFPVLLFARLSWAHQSWVFVYGGYGQKSVRGADIDRKLNPYVGAERFFLALHYLFMLKIMSWMPIVHAVLFFLVAQTSCGLMLALVFGLGHNGMAVYPADQRPDFWKLQVTTTRNVTSNWFVDFFCGGLQYQVEHHLFPSLPRHNLPAAHKLVEAFCKEHGVTYHEADMINGNIEVLLHLNEVTKEFVKEFPAM
jgi:fatty acid desaturase/predicted heme/steroid binding protein